MKQHPVLPLNSHRRKPERKVDNFEIKLEFNYLSLFHIYTVFYHRMVNRSTSPSYPGVHSPRNSAYHPAALHSNLSKQSACRRFLQIFLHFPRRAPLTVQNLFIYLLNIRTTKLPKQVSAEQ